MRKIISVAALCISAASPALADGSAENGANVFKKCAVCHSIGKDATNKVGPALTGIVGAKAATIEGFNYSAAMKAKGDEGWIWDDSHLTEWLADPKTAVKGTKMAFPGLKNPQDIADVIAYLKTFPKAQ